MIKVLHDGNYDGYVAHQKRKLDTYLKHSGKMTALNNLAERHYTALKSRLQGVDVRNKKVLCLAARLGQEVRAFRDSGAFAVGIDLNPGPDNPYVHYGDFHDIQFPDKSVDIIYSNSLDHAFDMTVFASEIVRVLKNDGLLILEIQKGEDAGVKAETWEACWWDSVNDVVDKFAAMGFNTVRQYDISVPFAAKNITLTLDDNFRPPVVISKNIVHRNELATIVGGVGVELGVAAGDYSEQILKNEKVTKLFSIDRWGNDGKHNDKESASVVRRFEKYGKRSMIIRRTFQDVVNSFNQIFDFIYIDGYAHTGQESGKTLEQWWPLLKSGGIFAGHDYHPRWPLTVDAVDNFVRQHGLTLNVTKESPLKVKNEFPSWWVVKP